MKKLLSLLMCYVFLQAETFALRGGPGGGNGARVAGTFSGVMIENDGLGTDVGLFLLNAATGGASTGQLVIFSQSAASSEAYDCNMTGLTDSSRGGSGKFFGVFTGAAVVTANGVVKSISGQVTLQVAAGATSQSPRVTGTGSSRTNITTAAAGGGGGGGAPAPAPAAAPLKTYTVDGWQTSTTNNTGLAL